MLAFFLATAAALWISPLLASSYEYKTLKSPHNIPFEGSDIAVATATAYGISQPSLNKRGSGFEGVNPKSEQPRFATPAPPTSHRPSAPEEA